MAMFEQVTDEQAESWVKSAGVAMWIIAGLTAAVGVAGLAGVGGLDGSALIDAFILVVLAPLCFPLKSRTAFALATLYYATDKILTLIDGEGKPTGLFVGLAITIMLGRGFIGAVVQNRARRLAEPNYRKGAGYMAGRVGAGCLGTGLGLLLALGVFVELGSVPEADVMDGTAVPAEAHRDLVNAGVLDEGEAIELIYGGGFTWTSEGAVLTDRRAIAYGEDSGGAFAVHAVSRADAVTATLLPQTTGLGEALVHIADRTGVGVTLSLPDAEQAALFLQRLGLPAAPSAPEGAPANDEAAAPADDEAAAPADDAE